MYEDNNRYLYVGIYGGGLYRSIDPVTSVETDNETMPNKFFLSQNYPNPFNPSTTIKYSIPQNVKREMSNVKLVVYDVLGREIATLVNEKQSAGNYEVKFDGKDLSSGIYFYRLKAGSFFETKKMILLR